MYIFWKNEASRQFQRRATYRRTYKTGHGGLLRQIIGNIKLLDFWFLKVDFMFTAASAGRPPKFVLVTQSSRGIDLALLRLDLLEGKCSSLVKKYQGPRT